MSHKEEIKDFHQTDEIEEIIAEQELNEVEVEQEKEIKDEVIDLKAALKKVAQYDQKVSDVIKTELNKLKESYLIQVASNQTVVRRHQQELIDTKKYGGTNLAEDILKPIDLMKKVINTPVQNEELKNYLIGFEMIMNQIEQAFEANGITKINTKIGDEFDHKIHNANDQIETDAFKTNQIVEVISNGYKLYDRVIIHTLVKVAK